MSITLGSFPERFPDGFTPCQLGTCFIDVLLTDWDLGVSGTSGNKGGNEVVNQYESDEYVDNCTLFHCPKTQKAHLMMTKMDLAKKPREESKPREKLVYEQFLKQCSEVENDIAGISNSDGDPIGVPIGVPNEGGILDSEFSTLHSWKDIRVYHNIGLYHKVRDGGCPQRNSARNTKESSDASSIPVCNSSTSSSSVHPRIRLACCILLHDRSGKYSLWTRRHAKMRNFPRAWVLPGGHVDAGESLEEAAVRECQEEVGIDLKSDDLGPIFFTWESSFGCNEGRENILLPKIQHLVVYYSVILPHSKEEISLKISENEIDQWGWFETEKLMRVQEGKEQEKEELIPGFEIDSSSAIKATKFSLNTIRPPYYFKQEGIPPAHEKAIELYLFSHQKK